MSVIRLVRLGAWLVIAGSVSGQGELSTLSEHLSLEVGTEVLFAGTSSYRIQQGDGEPSENTSEVTMHLTVLDRSASAVEIAQVAVRGDPSAVGLSFGTLGLSDGSWTESSEHVGFLPLFRKDLIPQVDWPLDWSSFVRTERFDVAAFGLQPGNEPELPVRFAVSGVQGLPQRKRIELTLDGELPVSVTVRGVPLLIHEHTREFVVDLEVGQLVSRRSRTEVEVYGTVQVREAVMILEAHEVPSGVEVAARAKRLGVLRSALRVMRAEPGQALADVEALGDDDDIVQLVVAKAQGYQAQAQEAAAQQARLDSLIGAVAPDFTLNTLDGEPLSLRKARGKIVLLTFWGFG